MSAHTPGPWQVDADCGDSGHDVIYDAQGRKLALVFSVDAALIAAAPDLLAAAKRALDWLASYPGNGAQGAYDALRASIAKAEGRG